MRIRLPRLGVLLGGGVRYLSVCSGIEAATVAWHPLGWKPVAFSEIEKFPSAVLSHHYPDAPNLGDMTKFKEWDIEPGTVDILVGGTPCQSFSVAGLRKGMDDPRGNLALVYLALADRLRPRWVVWENVPGVLSVNGGRDFGAFLGALGKLGYGFIYRVLDGGYWGTPMHNRHVFVVGYSGDWRPATAVLFERAPAVKRRTPLEWLPRVDASSLAKRQTMPERGRCWVVGMPGEHRFLTPVEVERLYGFPDNYTRIPWRGKPAEDCPDGPRYKALGNSMAVPVMRWIGERMAAVEGILVERAA